MTHTITVLGIWDTYMVFIRTLSFTFEILISRLYLRVTWNSVVCSMSKTRQFSGYYGYRSETLLWFYEDVKKKIFIGQWPYQTSRGKFLGRTVLTVSTLSLMIPQVVISIYSLIVIYHTYSKVNSKWVTLHII